MTKSRLYLSIVGTLSVGAILLFGWPTRYRYDHLTEDNNLIRIDRFNGDIEVFRLDKGWHPIENEEIRTERAKAEITRISEKQEAERLIADQEKMQFLESNGQIISKDELIHIKASCTVKSEKEISCKVANQTANLFLAAVVFEITKGGLLAELEENPVIFTLSTSFPDPIKPGEERTITAESHGLPGISSTSIYGASGNLGATSVGESQ